MRYGILLLTLIAINCSAQKHLMYDSLNATRQANGLSPLKRSIGLEIKAKVHLMRMQYRYGGKLVHGRGPEVLTDMCYDPIGCWLGSKRHRKILLSNRKHIGIALYRSFACGKLR